MRSLNFSSINFKCKLAEKTLCLHKIINPCVNDYAGTKILLPWYHPDFCTKRANTPLTDNGVSRHNLPEISVMPLRRELHRKGYTIRFQPRRIFSVEYHSDGYFLRHSVIHKTYYNTAELQNSRAFKIYSENHKFLIIFIFENP